MVCFDSRKEHKKSAMVYTINKLFPTLEDYCTFKSNITMHDSQLMDMFRTLSQEDLSALKDFIRSPVFNPSSRAQWVSLLYDALASAYPDFSQEEWQRDRIYEKLFPGHVFVEGRLEKVMTELLKVLRRYVVYKHSGMEEESVPFQMTLARYYRDHGLESKFLGTLDKLRRQSDELARPGSTDLYLRFRIEEILHDHLIIHYQKKGDANLQETIDRLDTFYMAERLILTGALLTIRSHTEFDEDRLMHMVHAISAYMDKGFQEDHPVLRGFCLAALIIHRRYEGCESEFEALRQLLEQHRDSLPADYQKNLAACCRNYCTWQINNGNNTYYAIQFEMIRQQLTSGVLYHQGGLLPPTLQNIVNSGLKMKAYEWVKDLLVTHRNRITGTHHPEEVYHFNLSNYYFHTGNYDEALDLLTGSYDDVLYNMRAKCTEIKIFYEKQELSLVESRLEAFKVYILRQFPKLISENTKTSYIQFVYLIKRMIHPATRFDIRRQERIREEIRTLPHLVDRDWLMEKMEEIKPANRS